MSRLLDSFLSPDSISHQFLSFLFISFLKFLRILNWTLPTVNIFSVMKSNWKLAKSRYYIFSWVLYNSVDFHSHPVCACSSAWGSLPISQSSTQTHTHTKRQERNGILVYKREKENEYVVDRYGDVPNSFSCIWLNSPSLSLSRSQEEGKIKKAVPFIFSLFLPLASVSHRIKCIRANKNPFNLWSTVPKCMKRDGNEIHGGRVIHPFIHLFHYGCWLDFYIYIWCPLETV